MIRKCTDEDISDKELEKVIDPFYDNYHEYIITYVMPKIIAFYIASSYSRNAMWAVGVEKIIFLDYLPSDASVRKPHPSLVWFETNIAPELLQNNSYYFGLKVIRIHDFRHSSASLLINNGANVTLVAKCLGHTKIDETLNTYSHMFSTALDSVVSVIDSLEDD